LLNINHLQKQCTKNGKLDKSCGSNNIYTFVQKNVDTNVFILNNAFRVPHIPKKTATMLSVPKTQGVPFKN
jgi:hypothetical protein